MPEKVEEEEPPEEAPELEPEQQVFFNNYEYFSSTKWDYKIPITKPIKLKNKVRRPAKTKLRSFDDN